MEPPGSYRIILRPTEVVRTRQQLRDGDRMPISILWKATGGTITPDGLYTAGPAGVYQVIAKTVDGRLADSATVYVLQMPARSATSKSAMRMGTGRTTPMIATIGAPGLPVHCLGASEDFLTIDAGLPIMFSGSSRQIRIGGCVAGKSVVQVAYAFASAGKLTPELRYESDGGDIPALVKIQAGTGSGAATTATIVIVPNFLKLSLLVAVWSFIMRRNRTTSRGRTTKRVKVFVRRTRPLARRATTSLPPSAWGLKPGVVRR
jgi:hypothetical protein